MKGVGKGVNLRLCLSIIVTIKFHVMKADPSPRPQYGCPGTNSAALAQSLAPGPGIDPLGSGSDGPTSEAE